MHQKKTFIFGDIHGEFDKLMTLIDLLKEKEGLSLEAGDTIVSLGDKNDRGPNTKRVFDAFMLWQKMWGKEQVVCILGNHEDFLADSIMGSGARHGLELLMMNGGKQTIKSYDIHQGMPEWINRFRASFMVAGHYEFLMEHVLWYETEQAFFCHSPIPKVKPVTWQANRQLLTWGPMSGNYRTQEWVDHSLIPGKLSFHGHIHGISWDDEKDCAIIPRVRRHGSSILVDTGCGCHQDGVLSCAVLPEDPTRIWNDPVTIWNSNGETYFV